MADKPIQEQFGETVLEAFRAFARQDLGNPAEYEATYFQHVADGQLRAALAETMYGARWLYKLGLALLVQDAEQLAHVRAQVVDYASICEGLLGDMIRHAISNNLVIGTKYRFKNTRKLANKLDWTNGLLPVLAELSFLWCIDVALDEGIIDSDLAHRCHVLRKERNAVHLRSRTYKAYINTSRSAFNVLTDTIQKTRDWRNSHP
jgi:hypothetical protein